MVGGIIPLRRATSSRYDGRLGQESASDIVTGDFAGLLGGGRLRLFEIGRRQHRPRTAILRPAASNAHEGYVGVAGTGCPPRRVLARNVRRLRARPRDVPKLTGRENRPAPSAHLHRAHIREIAIRT